MILSKGNYLFDTTVFIHALRNVQTAKNLIYQVRFNEDISAGYSIISESELWVGIGGLRTEDQHIILLKPFRRYFVNVTIARRAGYLLRQMKALKLSSHDTPSLPDCIIAATAEFYNLTVCTSNKDHFELFKPFSISVQSYDVNG